jgi:5-methylcytosine-specific restriction endonuclease McrA
MYPDIGPCVSCGAERSERHHIDGDTRNNTPENVISMCRKCHMREDGRLEQFKAMASERG